MDMTDPKLLEVGKRLEEAVKRISEGNHSNELLSDRYLGAAIAILDSEHCDYPPGVLEQYLSNYLADLNLPEQ
jgi:hypothetical protein